MAILINAHQLSKSFTARPLFDGVSLSIESGQRLGLIGPNGAGKSTLLKILAGRVQPDEGALSVQKGLQVGYLEQVPSFASGASVQSTLMEGCRDPGDWREIARSQMLMSKLDLDSPDALVAELSGGWKKRVALARELMRDPDLLLLDEPTNHLDVDSIQWLEEFLSQAPFATVVITHDRLFLQRVSNQIIELDRRHKDGLLRVDGDYATYLELREQMLNAQEQREIKLRSTLRRETEWLRAGVQARQTKQRARMDQHAVLSEEVSELKERNVNAKVRLDFQSAEKTPKKLIEAKAVQKSYGCQIVVPAMDLLVTPKSRIGLLGANGCGKSTLIRLLVGQEPPDRGEVFRSDSLKVSYFEQNRESLDPKVTVLKTICPAGDFVMYGDVSVHAKSYLTRFLFSYDQMDMPVEKLSGGEQSRLLIARLMLQPANVLILDEPTNDLDMATLDVLQEVLAEFAGAVILVTHDRYFLDHVANQILAFEKNPNDEKLIERFADLSQWEAWRTERKKEISKTAPAAELQSSTSSPAKPVKRKLSYKDQRELDGMEEKIEGLERRLNELMMESQNPALTSAADRLVEVTTQMADLQIEIDRLYERWAELSGE